MKTLFRHPNYESKLLGASIYELLSTSSLWSMATVNADGTSHINTAYYCHDDNFVFYFLTPPSTQHSKNLVHNSSASVTIFDSNQQFGENPLRGLQLFGTSVLAENESKAYQTYGMRFPGFLKWIESLDEESKKNIESKFYAFLPQKIKLFDEKTFGEETFITITL